jgi:CheY-like chemotaxis protein
MMFAQRTNPDVILLDIGMPACNGLEVLQKLKTSSITSKIPIIVVSGSINAEAERKVIEGGAVALMRKPADMGKIYEVICQVFKTGSEPSHASERNGLNVN